jgi:hypothetical protein
MMRLTTCLSTLLTLGAGTATAGNFGVREYPATVKSVTVSATYSMPDHWAAAFDRPGLTIEGPGPVCAIELAVAFPGPKFREAYGRQVAFASEGGCAKLRRGQAVWVQTMGLANELQVVSISIDGAWFSLPLMRASAAIREPSVQACLKPATDPRCRPLLGTAAL